MSPALRPTAAGVQQQVVQQVALTTTAGWDSMADSAISTSGGNRMTAIPARAHTSPSDPLTAQLVILDSSLVASAAHYEQWGRQLAAHGFTRMRTGALAPRQATHAQTAGMQCIQELVLLEATAPLHVGDARQRPTRPLPRHLEHLVRVDHAAFGDEWHLDATMLDEVRTATPAARRRIVTFRELHRSLGNLAPAAADDPGPVAGFLVSGRSARTGYIQRLAVHPHARRSGVAASLLSDALDWLRRRRTERVFVNTHVENLPALTLYRAHGFEDMPERLRVFEGPTQR